MNFLKSISKAYNKEKLDFIFQSECSKLAIKYFSTVYININNEFKTLNTYPDEWYNLYIQNNFFLYDPVYDIINDTYLPQPWNINALNTVNEKQVFFLKQTSHHEINYGFSIPIRGINNSKIFFTELYKNEMSYENQYIMSHASILYWDKMNEFHAE